MSQEKKFEKKTALPLLHVKTIGIPSGVQGRYVSKFSISRLAEMLRALKKRYEGVYEMIITPDNIDIEIECEPVIVLNVHNDTDVERIIKELDRLGGKNNDTPGDGNPVDGCEESEGLCRPSV